MESRIPPRKTHQNKIWGHFHEYEYGDPIDNYWSGFCEDNPEHPVCVEVIPEPWVPDDDGGGEQPCMNGVNYFVDSGGQCYTFTTNSDWGTVQQNCCEELLENTHYGSQEDWMWTDAWDVDGDGEGDLVQCGLASGSDDDSPECTGCQGCGNCESQLIQAMAGDFNCCPGTYEDCLYNGNCSDNPAC